MMVVATASPILLAEYGKYIEQFSLVISAGNFQALQAALTKIKPRLVFIDFSLPGFNPLDDIVKLRLTDPKAKIIGIGPRLTEEDELKLFVAGLRGYCNQYTELNQVTRMITAVLQGEIWMSRSLTSRLLKQLQAPSERAIQPSHPAQKSLAVLTHREKEIAQLVGKGQNNRQIALALNISERTVKAHLTEIFRKLCVSDRLSLALWLTASNAPIANERQIAVNDIFLDSDLVYMTNPVS